MGKKEDDDLMSFLAGIPGATFVNVSKNGVTEMDGPTHERLRHLHKRGVSLHGQRKYKEAIKCFKDAIDQGFEHSKNYLNIGVCYGELGQWGKALKWLRLAHSKFPHDDQITRNLAVAESDAAARKKWWQFWK